MARRLPTIVTAVALLATPGCSGEVKEEDHGPFSGLFWVDQISPNRAWVAASFHKRTYHGPTEVDRDGPCWLDRDELPSASPTPPIELDAGELRVTGGLEELVAEFDDGYEFPEKTAVFEAGDALTLDVEGSDRIPSMSVMLPAPPVPVIAPPPATIDTGEDLTFTWTSPPGTGTLTIQLAGYATNDGGTSWFPVDTVRCRADISQGTLTMPASLLLQVSNARPEGATVAANVNNYERRDVGVSFVGFSVNATAATPGGGQYVFDADLKK